jgi:hypothetical protein
MSVAERRNVFVLARTKESGQSHGGVVRQTNVLAGIVGLVVGFFLGYLASASFQFARIRFAEAQADAAQMKLLELADQARSAELLITWYRGEGERLEHEFLKVDRERGEALLRVVNMAAQLSDLDAQVQVGTVESQKNKR